jgi:hypothetical protein
MFLITGENHGGFVDSLNSHRHSCLESRSEIRSGFGFDTLRFKTQRRLQKLRYWLWGLFLVDLYALKA